MKRIVILILFALSSSFVNAQKSEESTQLERLNLKPIGIVSDGHGRKIDVESKALRFNRNEYFKSETLDANITALSFLQEKQDVYGLSTNLNDIKITKTAASPSGEYVYCQQYVNDIPVFATNFIIYINKKNIVTYVLNEFRNIAKYENIKSKVSINIKDALKIANEYLNIKGGIIDEPKTELVYFESIDKGLELAWKINIISIEPMGDWQIFVSVNDGHIIHAEDISINANDNGKVFIPNPIVSANVSYGYNNCFLHNNGSTNSCLDGQLKQITFNDITYENRQYKLKGPYCEIKDKEAPFGHTIPELTTSNFYYTRTELEFGAVMCYYYVDLSARQIMQLGYNIPNGLNNFVIDPHGVNGRRNAHYVPSGNYIAMGSGYANGNAFVPACEDSDVILHEYGHAMQYNLGSGNATSSAENQSVKEGSSDYWATSFKRHLYPNHWAELGLWFREGVPVRRTDLNLIYPQDYVYGHNGGQIWSSALMKIWGDLGKEITDKLFLETHFIWGLSPNMRDAATAFIQADINLYNGIHLCNIITRFAEHGLIDPVINNVVTGSIETNNTWLNDMYTVGIITIENDVTLTIRSNVYSAPNTQIIVQPGGKLIIDGGKLTNSCSDKMWQGILVFGQRDKPQLPEYQGTVELKNNAVIEHALIAISAAPTG
ncbi:MAG: hypothetical protein LBH92_01210, partial [Bacteroidales bacterium]|nr:hypothetical protein [Bacteroidales bacterium]